MIVFGSRSISPEVVRGIEALVLVPPADPFI
jgi:hypothetical protein